MRYPVRSSRLLAAPTTFFLLCSLASHAHAEITIALDGKSSCVIVRAKDAIEPEKHAAKELAHFLGRVAGATFTAVEESQASEETSRIYVGQTAFAAAQGIEFNRLGEEEWVIRTVGKHLILTGGRPRGTLYAVYEFLEDHIGCHWLDRRTEVVPSRASIRLGKLDVQSKPWFWQRAVRSPTGCPDDQWGFMIRNKNYRYDFRGRKDFYPKGAFYRLHGPKRSAVHSFSQFVNAKDWFETHPEYFALDRRGKRIPAYDGAGPGQLCLTHPDVERLTLEKLREFIAADRIEAAQKGVPPPKIYWLTQNDKYDAHCQCKNCQAKAKAEASESGPLIHFVNRVASAIEKEHPKTLIGTLGYNQTSEPPRKLQPRHNVLIGWCDVYSKVDGIRPLSHAFNAENFGEITAWGKAGGRLGIGDDYWTSLSYYSAFPTPYSIVHCIASDLKLFADLGAKSFFAESAHYMEAGQQFVPLKFWLAYQLLVDPKQPVEPLLEIFMDGFFGAAGGKMRAYLNYLRKRIDSDAQFKMLRDAPHKLAYLDLEFFVTSSRLFDEAEALLEPDSLFARHVFDERFILDSALLWLWPWLERKLPPGEAMPFGREKVISRYERGWRSFVKGRYSRFYSKQKLSLNKDGKLMERMVGLFREPKLPDQFSKLPRRDVADFNWLTFSHIRPRQRFVPDDEAAGRMTATFTTKSRIQAAEKGGDAPKLAADAQHQKPLKLGVDDDLTVTMGPNNLPQDGKYHLYRLGRIRVRPGTMVWALEGRRLGVIVDRLYVEDSDDPAANDWNAYISLKLRGPAYVRGSKEPNGVWMDRVLLVKPQPGEEVDPAYLAQLELERKRLAMRPRLEAPRITAGASGDPNKVDWASAATAPQWRTLKGDLSNRKLSASFLHDTEFLYVRLRDVMDTKQLVIHNDVFGGDDWEFLFAEKRGVRPYRQWAINPNGKSRDLAYGEAPWKSHVRAKSTIDRNVWTVTLSFPLKHLLPRGAKSGQTIYMNIMRGGKENLVWSPTFSGKFQALDRLGALILK